MFLCINIYGQNIYTGKLVMKGNPCPPSDLPCVPGLVFWLKTISGDYVISINSHRISSNNKMVIDDIEYLENDEVEITGTVSDLIDMHSEEYFNLEIETIKKLSSSNIELSSFDNNKVYYDAVKQVIVIGEMMQNQSLSFELVNTQGKVILRKTDIGNNTTISVESMLNGVYLYRLLHSNQIVCFDKILKIN